VDERVHVPAGGDRFQEHRKVLGTRRIDYEEGKETLRRPV
jgi:hypothetical protein